jgi:outer membrane protein insertion porin family
MYKIFLTILFFFIKIQFLSAEIIKDIKISGNKRISNETVKVYGKIDLNKDYNEVQINNILKDLYSTNFFEDVKVNLNNNILTIILKEYPVISQVLLLGEPSKGIKETIINLISTKKNSSFIRSNISKDINIIKKLYSSIGYNSSNVDIKVRSIDENSFDLIIDVDKGNLTKISSINFIGDKKIRDRRLRDVIASEEQQFWKFISKKTRFSESQINLDIRLLTNYYKSQGYYDVNINSNTAQINKDGNVDLIYSIDAGTRYRIGKITTNADSVFDGKIFFPLKKKYEKYIGEFYSPFSVKDLLEEIDILIENNNLQFVEHNVEEVIENDLIEVTFNIFESKKTLVERINILGNNVTNESVIRGELLVDEGDPYTDLSINKSIAKLKARNIFGKVTHSVEPGSQSNLKIININIEEKPTGEISAGAGVGTNGGAFSFNVSENNWLGEGKRVNFALDLSSESAEGVLNFTDPNYNFLGNSLNYYISSESNDKPNQGYENSIVSLGAQTSFEQYKDVDVNIGLLASYDDLRTDGNASNSLKKQSGEYSEIVANYGFANDTRNRAFKPTDGSIFGFNQSIPIIADKSFIDNTFTASKYVSLNENVVGASKFFISTINGLNNEDVRVSKRKSLSSSRLRGFKRGKVGPVDGKDHVGGNYASAINLEANLPNLLPESSRAEVGFFMDIGNVWGVDYDSTIGKGSKIRSSLGTGINWLSPIGPMSFILSQNLTKADTDETESFTFNLGTSF